jgi:hypothetical protein
MPKKKAIPDFDPGSDDEASAVLTVNHAFKKKFEETERKREYAYLDSKGLLDDSEDGSSEEESSDDEDALEAKSGELDEVAMKVLKKCAHFTNVEIFHHCF